MQQSLSTMGVLTEEVVSFQIRNDIANQTNDPHIITVNCPDQLGLACDLSRILLEFRLDVVRGGKASQCLSKSLIKEN